MSAMTYCKHCGYHITQGRAPFQNPEYWYASGFNSRFCPDAEGRPHAPQVGRSYTIGLPVTFTVEDDGKVTVDVDLSEVYDLSEDEEAYVRYGGLQVLRDALTVSEAADKVGNTHTFTLTTTEAS